MGVREPSVPKRAPARAPVVIGFYGALLLVGFFWHAVGQDSNDIWRLDATQSIPALLVTPLLGVVAGLVTVQIFRGLELRMTWLSKLHSEFQSMFGRPPGAELFILAAASAIGEEILFRGAMLDAWGLWISSIVFALLHIPPKRELWPWTASSLVLGFGLGALTLVTGNLGAAVAAHFVINLQNLAYITRKRPRMVLTGPVRPSPAGSTDVR